jgi:hypothetical protein
MQNVSVPRADLYKDEDMVIVEWQVGDVQRQARFGFVDVTEEDTDHDTEAVLLDVATLDDVGDMVEEGATIENIPGSVRWLVDNFAARPVGQADNETDGREDTRRGGAFE